MQLLTSDYKAVEQFARHTNVSICLPLGCLIDMLNTLSAVNFRQLHFASVQTTDKGMSEVLQFAFAANIWIAQKRNGTLSSTSNRKQPKPLLKPPPLILEQAR